MIHECVVLLKDTEDWCTKAGWECHSGETLPGHYHVSNKIWNICHSFSTHHHVSNKIWNMPLILNTWPCQQQNLKHMPLILSTSPCKQQNLKHASHSQHMTMSATKSETCRSFSTHHHVSNKIWNMPLILNTWPCQQQNLNFGGPVCHSVVNTYQFCVAKQTLNYDHTCAK